MKNEPRNVQSAPEPTPTRRCDNPDCDNRMEWSGGRGRPARYCSDACRQRTADNAARLHERVAAAEATLASGGTYRQRRAITTALKQLRWLLSAYPGQRDGPERRSS